MRRSTQLLATTVMQAGGVDQGLVWDFAMMKKVLNSKTLEFLFFLKLGFVEKLGFFSIEARVL